MSDRSSDDRDRPLSSDELLRQAKESLRGDVTDEAIEEIVGDLESIDIEVPTAERFPEPIKRLETGSRRPQRPRRVISAYDTADDPFDRDDRPVDRRAIVVAITALVLIAIGGVIALMAAATRM